MERNAAKRLTGAQIIVETLIEQGVTDVFGYPGGQVIDLYDALYHARRRLRHILTAHEQGAAHAADGYARATGKAGVVIATSGPGAANLVTGIATAMLDSIPMVAITGNVATTMIGRDSFQEINITGITLPITKHNYFVARVEELADTLREAFQIAKSGRPGPVLVDVPKDVQLARCSFVPQDVVPSYPQEEAADALIDQAARLIHEAKRPYLFIGGGAAGAGIALQIRQLAEKIDACVGCTLMGLSALPSSYDRFLGMQGIYGRYASSAACEEADLILAAGVRFSDRSTGDTARYARRSRIIHLDTDLAEINKNVKVDVGLIGDLSSSLTRILDRCDAQCHPEWQQRIREMKAREKQLRQAADQNRPADEITPIRLFDVINAGKDDRTIIATDVGQHQMWTAQYVDLERPRRFLSSGGLGTMGYGLGAAIGAHIATGDRVILITGDGSFGMNLNELATAVSYRIPMTIVLLNNGVLGMVRQWQTLFYGRRYASTGLHRKTDFVRLAQAFGAKAARAETMSAFRAAFASAQKQAGPFLIDIAVSPDEFVLPALPPDGAIIDDIIANAHTQEES